MSTEELLIQSLLEQLEAKDKLIKSLQQSLDKANKALEDITALAKNSKPKKAPTYVAPNDIIQYKKEHMAMSNADIAAHFKANTATVSRVLTKAGLPTKRDYVLGYIKKHKSMAPEKIAAKLEVSAAYVVGLKRREGI